MQLLFSTLSERYTAIVDLELRSAYCLKNLKWSFDYIEYASCYKDIQ